MKIHLIRKQAIEDYVLKNARSKASFEICLSIIKRVDWKEPIEIIKTFNSNTRVHLFVKWIGTHAEYTKLCNHGNQYEINMY